MIMTTLTRSTASLFVLALLTAAPSVAAQVTNGGLIGDPTGVPPGEWPNLATPPGNPFVSVPGEPFTPLPGSNTELRAHLGLALFWDEQLSTDGSTACATCHTFEAGGLDGRAAGVGMNLGLGSFGVMPQDASGGFTAGTSTAQQRQVTSLMAPTVFGAAFAQRLLWDNEVPQAFAQTVSNTTDFDTNAALEGVSVGPPLNTVEMSHMGRDFADVVERLNDAEMLALATPSTVPAPLQQWLSMGMTYDTLFDLVFANDPHFGSSVASGATRERFALAIATYMRTLIPNKAPVDERPLTTNEVKGFELLQGSGCFSCHSSSGIPTLTGFGGFMNPMDAMLTDHEIRPFNMNFPESPGATGEASGNLHVKTPSLRNTMLKPRFTHNGFLNDVNELLLFLNGDRPNLGFPLANLKVDLPGLPGQFPPPQRKLTFDELRRVKDFLVTLTDPRLVPANPGDQLPMPFSHPDLYSERVPTGSNEPSHLQGTNGTPGGLVPDIIAHVPAIEGDNYFKVGVRDAPPLSGARIVIAFTPLPAATPGGPLLLDLSGGIGVANRVTDQDGFATYEDTTALTVMAGQTLSFQWMIHDPTAGGAWVFSNAAEVVVQ